MIAAHTIIQYSIYNSKIHIIKYIKHNYTIVGYMYVIIVVFIIIIKCIAYIIVLYST